MRMVYDHFSKTLLGAVDWPFCVRPWNSPKAQCFNDVGICDTFKKNIHQTLGRKKTHIPHHHFFGKEIRVWTETLSVMIPFLTNSWTPRWFKVTPLQSQKGHLTIPKRSLWITWNLFCRAVAVIQIFTFTLLTTWPRLMCIVRLAPRAPSSWVVLARCGGRIFFFPLQGVEPQIKSRFSGLGLQQ